MTEIRMRGGGEYSAHSPGQRLIINRALPLMLEALGALDPASSNTAFGIADFGAADGGTSIAMLRAVLTELRARARSDQSRSPTPTYHTTTFRPCFGWCMACCQEVSTRG